MTARRGSLRHKLRRLARASSGEGGPPALRRLSRWSQIASRIALWSAGLLVAGAFGAQLWHVGADNYRLHKQIDAVERRDAALSDESARLRREAKLLHDPDYLVPLIHEQLGLVKPHEVIILVSPAPAADGK